MCRLGSGAGHDPARLRAVPALILRFHNEVLVLLLARLHGVQHPTFTVEDAAAALRLLRLGGRGQLLGRGLALLALFAISMTGLMLTASYTWMRGYGYDFLAVLHAITVIVTLLWLPEPAGFAPPAWRAAALAALMAVWWVSEAIPISATAFVPLVGATVATNGASLNANTAIPNTVVQQLLGGACAGRRADGSRRVAHAGAVRQLRRGGGRAPG